jgi:hypothetical protein
MEVNLSTGCYTVSLGDLRGLTDPRRKKGCSGVDKWLKKQARRPNYRNSRRSPCLPVSVSQLLFH